MKDLISILDVSVPDLERLMADAARLKAERAEGCCHPLLVGKSLAMIFEKPSTRTRVSFEVGMYELGGHALHLNQEDMQLRRGETVSDTARVLSRYVTGVMIRANSHATIEEFAAHATVPVINGLSDREHPCQILADIFTIRERFGRTDGLVAAWVGDGNNVLHSILEAAALMKFNVRVATPAGYEPDAEFVEMARAAGGTVTLTQDAVQAASGADVVVTDTWVSMGQEHAHNKLAAMALYQVDARLMALAKPDARFLHCLPAHVGEEVTEDIFESDQSVVFDEAENRIHAQKSVLLWSLGLL